MGESCSRQAAVYNGLYAPIDSLSHFQSIISSLPLDQLDHRTYFLLLFPTSTPIIRSLRNTRHPEKRLKRRRGNDSDSLRTRGRHHQQSYSSASGQAGKSENHHYKGTKRDDNQPRRHAVNSGLPKLLRTGSQIGPSLLTIILEFYSLISLGQSSSGQKKNSHMGQTGSHLVEQTFSGLQRYCLLRDVNTRHDQGAYGCMPHGSRRLFSTRQQARESKKCM